MAQNFLRCDREQELLLAPSLREWLAEDHLAWFVSDLVEEELDLTGFLAGYRQDGWGRAAFDPAMMVALLLYAYAIGERSSRGIERRCREDIAFRVITANQTPDHATLARFRVRHQDALAQVFTQSLALCAGAGMVQIGLVAVDGTKIHGNASREANRSYEHIAREILQEAATVDAGEDEQFGESRGDELPLELADRSSRRARLRAAKKRLEAELRQAHEAHAAHLKAREELEAERGRKLRGRKPVAPLAVVDPAAKANTTDPESRLIRGPRGFVQGYNAQAVCTPAQVIIAAEISTDSPDGRLLEPMITAARRELAQVGITKPPEVVLADGGYWNVPQIEQLVADGCQVIVNPDSSARPTRHDDDRKTGDKRVHGLYAHMQRVITSEHGADLYRHRQQMIEPIFAQTKVTRRADRFQRRGLQACRSEWRLLAATHNLLKLYRHTPTTA
jgi:transposase